MVKRNNWTDDDIEVLKQNYHKGLLHVETLLPNRTRNSLIKKAQSLNLKSDKTNYDLDFLKKIVSESHSFADVFKIGRAHV